MTKYNIKTIAAATLMAAAAWTVAACTSEEDDIFSQSAAERLNEVSGIYSERLTQSPGGWIMEYYPYTDNEDLLTGTGYLIANRFYRNGAVVTAMKNAASYNTLWTDSSAWQVLTYMGPVLTYNSYNRCLGRFSDPDDLDLTPGRYDDESGKGFQGDYEFVMVDVPEGGQHIMLKGVKRGLYHRLTRLPQGTDFEAYLDSITAFRTKMFVKDARWELVMTVDGQRFRMNRQDRGLSTVYPEGSDSTTYGWHMPFLVTKYDDRYHLRFKDTVMYQGVQMEQEFAYDPDQDKFVGMKNAANTIEGYPAPRFFSESLASAHKFQMTQATEKSEQMADLYSKLTAAMQSTMKYALSNVQLLENKTDGEDQAARQMVLRLTYRAKRGAQTVTQAISVVYDALLTDDGFTLSNMQPEETTAKVIERVPEVETFARTFLGTFTVTPAAVAFDLFTLRLQKVDDANLWTNMSYNN